MIGFVIPQEQSTWAVANAGVAVAGPRICSAALKNVKLSALRTKSGLFNKE